MTTTARAALALGALILPLSLAAGPCVAEDAIPRTPSPEGARAYIISPASGEKLTSPVTVRFGVSGMGVAPAGVQNPKTGHHHLIIDSELPAFDLPVPNDASHRHYGGGQTQATIELPPGVHKLQILLGDHNHVPHDPPVYSQPITIEVE